MHWPQRGLWYRVAPPEGEPIFRSHRFFLGVLFLVSLLAVTPNLRGDGVGYYAFVASVLIDGDLQFENEFRHADPAQCHLIFNEDGEVRERMRTPTGHTRNFYSVGPALFWAPFFVLADIGVHLHNAVVSDARRIPADGYSWPYLLLCAMGSALLGFLGLAFGYAVARSLSGRQAALLALLGIWLASNLPVYMYLLPFRSHAQSAFIDGAFVWYWWRTWREPDAGDPLLRTSVQWAILGLLAGLMLTTYYMAGLLWIFIALDGLALLRAWQRAGSPLGRQALWILRIAAPLFLGIAVGALPHFAVKWVLEGAPFSLGYQMPWFWTAPKTLHVLFASEHGLWVWTPVLLLACLGLIPLTRRHPALGWRSVLSFLICVYLMGSKLSWHAGSSFGNRYFLVLTPIFVIGLAEFLRAAHAWLDARRPGLASPLLSLAMAALVVWNAGFVFQWAANLIPNRGPISFAAMAHNQISVVPAMLVRNAVPILFNRGAFIEKVEKEDLEEEVEGVELRPGICKG